MTATFVSPASPRFFHDFTEQLEHAGSLGTFLIVKNKKLGFSVVAKSDRCFATLARYFSSDSYDFKSHVRDIDQIVEKKLACIPQSQEEREALFDELLKAYKLLDEVQKVCIYRGSGPQPLQERQKSCFEALCRLQPISPFRVALMLGEYEMAVELCKESWPGVEVGEANEYASSFFSAAAEANEKEIALATLYYIATSTQYSVATSYLLKSIRYAVEHDKEEECVAILSKFTESLSNSSGLSLREFFIQALAKRMLKVVEVLRYSVLPTAAQQEKIDELQAENAFETCDHTLRVGKVIFAVPFQYVQEHIPYLKSYARGKNVTHLHPSIHNPQAVGDYLNALVGKYHIADEADLARIVAFVMQSQRFGDERRAKLASLRIATLMQQQIPDEEARKAYCHNLRIELEEVEPYLYEKLF